MLFCGSRKVYRIQFDYESLFFQLEMDARNDSGVAGGCGGFVVGMWSSVCLDLHCRDDIYVY